MVRRQQEGEVKPSESDTIEPGEAVKASILVVDDEQDTLQLVRQTLELEGFAVTVAGNGNSALALLAEREPDLVLLDIRMPGLNGYQVLKRIRESSNVPVLMLTASGEQTAIERSLGLGADDYIRKPFLTRVLVANIRAKLRRARGELRRTNNRTA